MSKKKTKKIKSMNETYRIKALILRHLLNNKKQKKTSASKNSVFNKRIILKFTPKIKFFDFKFPSTVKHN